MLDSLPSPLLLAICRLLPCSALASLALSCRRLHAHVQHVAWTRLRLDDASVVLAQRAVVRAAEKQSTGAQFNLLHAVREVRFEWSAFTRASPNRVAAAMSALAMLVSGARLLESLEMRTPSVNSSSLDALLTAIAADSEQVLDSHSKVTSPPTTPSSSCLQKLVIRATDGTMLSDRQLALLVHNKSFARLTLLELPLPSTLYVTAALSTMLKQLPPLTDVTLAGLDDAAVQCLVTVAGSLTCIRLTDLRVSEDKALIALLEAAPDLKFLLLSVNLNADSTAQKQSRASEMRIDETDVLQRNTFRVGNSILRAIASTSLQYLELPYAAFDDGGTSILTSRKGRHLHTIRIPHALAISDPSARMIGDRCRNLVDLDISGTLITDDGLQSLASGCRSLQSLRISLCSRIGDAGVASVAQRLSALRDLYLNNMDITDLSLKHLAERTTSSLITLQASMCPRICISPESRRDLIETIRKYPGLSRVAIHSTQSSALSNILQSSRTPE